jgi:hypothetical protein
VKFLSFSLFFLLSHQQFQWKILLFGFFKEIFHLLSILGIQHARSLVFLQKDFPDSFFFFSRRNIQIEKLQIVVEIWQKIWKEIKTGPIALWVQLIVTEAINFSKISNGRDKNFSRLNL